MRRFLTLLILLMPSLALAGTCGNGYGHSNQIILQKAVGSDLSNFPYPLVGTYSVLKTAANGGQVQNTANNSIGVSGPADLVICDAASGGNALKYEVANYSATTGAFEIWVLIATLHTATNDSIYLFTNNSGVVTSQQDLSLWTDASAKSVYHVNDNAASTTVLDSLGNNGASGANTSTNTITGQISTALNQPGMPVTVSGTSQLISGTGTRSLRCWFKLSSTGSDQPLCGYGPGSNGSAFGLFYGTGSAGINFTGFAADVNTSEFVSTNTWHQIYVTYNNASSPKMKIYFDGAAVGAGGNPTLNTTANNFLLGKLSWQSTCSACSIDDTRLESAERSADWVATTYNVETLPGYQIVGQTFSTPTIVNITSCRSSTITSTMTCPLGFSLTASANNYLILSIADNGGSGACNGSVTDSLGLTYTKHVMSHSNAGATDGYTCIYSAPITASGADTVSIPVSNAAWAFIYNVEAVTASGIATATTDLDQSTTISATAPSSNSFLLCATIGASAAVFPSSVTPSSYTFRFLGGFDPAFSYRYLGSANGVVSSGSQSCAFNAGRGGTLAIFGVAAQTASKRRPSQVY